MKKTSFFILAFFCAVFSATVVSAKNNVSDIDINVMLKSDGSADIKQIWTGTFDDGTEVYIPINTSDIEVGGFFVSDEKGEYTPADDWDVSASFEQKARRCGINKTDDGVELCFGISDYGKKRYSIEYTVSGYVKSYSECDGSNFRLVNPAMDTFPTNVNVRIQTQNGKMLTADNTQIWAFGYRGQIEFKNGCVLAYTEKSLAGEENVTVLLRFERGIFNPTYKSELSFEQVKNTAFDGSDYTNKNGKTIAVIFAALFVLALIAALVALVREMKRRRAIAAFCSQAAYFRDVPCKNDLYMAHFIARKFMISDRDSHIIGAALMKMLNDGVLCLQTQQRENIIGKTKKVISLQLIKEPSDALLKNLYSVLKAAAGEDGILQEKELKKYAARKPEKIESFTDKALGTGEQHFKREGGYVKPDKNAISNLTETGKNYLAQTAGLRNYLREFSLISEREIGEGVIWKDYIVYATLFGIADKVIEQMKRVYPDKIDEITQYNQQMIILGSYSNTMYSSAYQSIQSRRVSGMGGSSSVGGGGGFSGGGIGGGTR